MAVKDRSERRSLTDVIVAHDLALQTKYYAKNILQTESSSKCRLYKKFDETVEYIISPCPVLAKEQHISRHDRACDQLHLNICKETEVKLANEHWYDHVTKLFKTSCEGKINILWNQQVNRY